MKLLDNTEEKMKKKNVYQKYFNKNIWKLIS